MNPTLLIAAFACFIGAIVCEIAERKSRQWYQDRMMLRAAGFFFGIGCVLLGCAIAS